MSDRLYAELRKADVTEGKLTGYASVFDQATRIRGHYEVIARSAFEGALPTADVRFLLNHDHNLLLGRQSAGTLRLWTDDRGLGFEVDLPDTTAGRDVRELVRRGDLDGASFAFVPGEDSWGRAKDGTAVRTHTSVARLIDASVVTLPAYEGTVVHLRADEITPAARPDRNRSLLVRARHNARSVR